MTTMLETILLFTNTNRLVFSQLVAQVMILLFCEYVLYVLYNYGPTFYNYMS